MSLSSHVPDAGPGLPAVAVPVRLSIDIGSAATLLFPAVTNSDGRYGYQADGQDVGLSAGAQELTFHTPRLSGPGSARTSR